MLVITQSLGLVVPGIKIGGIILHKFGSTGIVTGYIKQLLASFNLPTTRIYTREHEAYFEKHLQESPYILESFDDLSLIVPEPSKNSHDNITGSLNNQVNNTSYIPYLKEGRLQFYRSGYYTTDKTFVPGAWQSKDIDVTQVAGGPWQIYNRGQYYANHTKQLQIKNNLYDSYTHEYLGDYLRFLRDYDNIDLMPLYNCFSNRICMGRNVVDIQTTLRTGKNSVQIVLDPLDSNYKIYVVPVKLFKNYTIAIDSEYPIEFCCGLYNIGIDTSKTEYKDLIKKTYMRKTSTSFSQPFLYTALTELAPATLPKHPLDSDILAHKSSRQLLALIAPREEELKLFIKVPKQTESSIVILEGDYCNWNDFTASNIRMDETERKLVVNTNYSVIANEAIFSEAPLVLKTPLQLLRFNTKTQIPFANRLLEYLLDGCITGGDNEVRENVLAAQYLVSARYHGAVDRADSIIFKTVNTSDSSKLPHNVCVQLLPIKTSRADCKTTGDLCIDYKAHSSVDIHEQQLGHKKGACKHILQLVNIHTKEFKDLGAFDYWIANQFFSIKTEDGVIKQAYRVKESAQDCLLVGEAYLDTSKQEYRVLVDKKTRAFEAAPAAGFTIYNCRGEYISSNPLAINYNLFNGVWSDSLRKIFYNYMVNNKSQDFYRNQDLLGYVDKDVEASFAATVADAKGKPIKKSLLNVDVWEDLKE